MDDNWHGVLTKQNIKEVGEKIFEMIGNHQYSLTYFNAEKSNIPTIKMGCFLDFSNGSPFSCTVSRIVEAGGDFHFEDNYDGWTAFVGDEIVLLPNVISISGTTYAKTPYYYLIYISSEE